MNYNHVCECDAKIYASGLIVMYKPHSFGERSKEQLGWQAKQERHYTISKSKVMSACIRAWQKKSSKFMLFLTFTFPFNPSEKEAADIWNRMLKNLKQNYDVKYYVWVKERQKSGRLHYHILVDRNRIHIKNLQSSFNSAIRHCRSDVFVSDNSVRLGRNPIVRSIESVSKYLCKYISKQSGDDVQPFTYKAYGFTTGMSICRKLNTDNLMELYWKYGFNLVHSDKFFELYQLKCDFIELSIDINENSS